MKHRFRFLALCLVCLLASGMSAQTWTASVPGEGTFYLYNVGNEGFMRGANDWSTRASITKEGGIPVTLVAGSNANEFYISTSPTYNDLYLGADGYVDKGSGDADNYTAWKFIAVENTENTYYLQSVKTSKYLVGHASDNTKTSVVDALLGNNKDYWKLATKEALLANFTNATEASPIDATFLIIDPYFGRVTNASGVWSGNSFNLGGYESGATQNYCAECYNKTFDVYQEISGVPNGIYGIKCQGFYRIGGRTDATTRRNNGEEVLNAKYYINGSEGGLMSIFDGSYAKSYTANYNENSAYTVNGEARYLPNNMSQAANCMRKGDYQNDVVTAVVADGTIRLGVKKTVAVNNDWSIFDNFVLTYYGVDLTAIKEAALVQWDEYNAMTVEGGDRTTYDATLATIKSAIENATEESAIGEALKGLKPAYQIYQSSPEVTGVPLNLTDMLVNADLKGGSAGWTATVTGGNFTFDTGVTPAVAEAYAGWDNLALTAFSLKQTEAITLSPGKYRLKVNAFYRYGVSYNSDGDTPRSLAYMFAGDNRQEIARLGDLVQANYPNSIADASASFAAGNYVNSMLFTLDEPTTLTFGVEGTHDIKQSWFITGPMTLEKVMENDALGEYITRWEALKTITNQALDHNAFDATVENGATATTEEEMEAADAAVMFAFRTLLTTGTTATGQFDITSLVDGTTSYDGAQELFNQASGQVEYVVANMPAGTYTVKAQAFHRSLSSEPASIAYENGTDVVAASLYLNTTSALVKNINDDARYLPLRSGSDVPGAYQRSIPNTLNGVTDAFNAGLYWNLLTVTTTEDGDIIFGLRVENGQASNWLAYNNFRLYYGAAKTAVSLSVTEPYAITEDTRADVTTDIALRAGEYNKVCLPFDLTAEQVTANFSGAYTLAGVSSDGSALTGTLVPAATMKAGQSYFVTVAADKNLSVNDVVLRAAAPEETHVIWEGATTTGSYNGYSFVVTPSSEYTALASTLTFAPIDFANVSFTTNLENWQARRFINENTYDQSATSVVETYNVAPPSRRDQPHSVFIPVPANAAALTLSVSLNSDYSSATTYNFAAGTTLCEVPNLVPQNTYYYKVEANDAVITQGQFNTEGRLRMIKATSGSNIRDLGGWLTLDGNRIKYGLIYRGGEMNAGHTMNAADIQVMRGLNIGGEVDFREDVDFSDQTLHDASALGNDVAYTYENLHMFNDDALQQKADVFLDAFTLTLNTLRQNKSVFFHCIWGADRTGCYAMLLEGLLGLTEDQLCKDYELTTFSHAGLRNKNGLDSKFNYIKTMPGETLQEQFYNYWRVGVGISKENLLEFITLMTDGTPSILSASLPEYGVTPVVADGDYYIYVPATEQFVARGDNWGTRVMLDNYGIPTHIATTGFGVTTIQFLDSKLFLGSDVYTDKSASYNTINWTVEQSGEDGFVLKSAAGNYIQLENDGKLRLTAETAEAAAVFTVKTLAEQKAIVAAKHLASANAALQAAGINIGATSIDDVQTALGTYKQSSATIKSATAGNTTDWVLTQAGSQQDVWNAYNTGSYGAELYQKCGSTVSQTITVPRAGLYKLTLNALYRQGQNDRCYELGQQGYELSDAWVSVNGTYFAQIPSWYSDRAGDANPNNTDEAKALMDAGKYAMEVYAYVGDDKQLTISINEPGYLAGSWCLFNNFALTEYAKKMTIDEAATTAPESCDFADVTLTRTLKGGQWNGFSLPFSLTQEQLEASPLNGATIMKYASANGNELSFAATNTIEAGDPYLIKPESTIENPVFTGVNVTNPEEAVKGEGDYKLAAHLYNTSLATDGSVAYVSTNDSSIKKLTSGGIKGLRSYFQIPTGNSVKALVLKFDDTTGIAQLREDGEVIDGAPIYNVVGQRLQKAQRGVNIVNGKKVIMK